MSSDMRGEYTLEPLTYSIHHRGVQLVDLVKYPMDKYMVKDRAHGTGLINLWLVICGQLMELWTFQQDSHTLRT